MDLKVEAQLKVLNEKIDGLNNVIENAGNSQNRTATALNWLTFAIAIVTAIDVGIPFIIALLK